MHTIEQTDMKYVDITKRRPVQQKKSRKKIKGVFLALILMGSTAFFLRNEVKAIFNPISIVSSVSHADLKESDGRTNILVLGSDKRSEDNRTSVLTDTILLVSIGRVEKDVVMISLPRDLWVKSPTGYSKINEVYTYNGGDGISTVVEDVLGLPIHYYTVINFELFRDSIDVLGGVEVDVETAFVDKYYPVEGKENAPLSERYETVSFDAGKQTMDGDTALKFVRSRKGNNLEGTDFARSARQQKVIMAIKNRALSIDTLINPVKLKELYDLYSQNVDTDVSFQDIQNFYLLSQQIDFNRVDSFVLDDRSAANEGGLLHSPEDTTLYGGAYVLLPNVGDFSQLHAYVQRYIFGEKR